MNSKKTKRNNKKSLNPVNRYVTIATASTFFAVWFFALFLPAYTPFDGSHVITGGLAFIEGGLASFITIPLLFSNLVSGPASIGVIISGLALPGAWLANFIAVAALVFSGIGEYGRALSLAFLAFLLSFFALQITDVGVDAPVHVQPDIAINVWIFSLFIVFIGMLLNFYIHRSKN